MPPRTSNNDRMDRMENNLVKLDSKVTSLETKVTSLDTKVDAMATASTEQGHDIKKVLVYIEGSPLDGERGGVVKRLDTTERDVACLKSEREAIINQISGGRRVLHWVWASITIAAAVISWVVSNYQSAKEIADSRSAHEEPHVHQTK